MNNIKTMRNLKSVLLVGALMFSGLGLAAPVDINSADAKTLAKVIKGVGDKKARDIVAYREKNGPYRSVDDLSKIKGIGKKTIDKNRENLTVGGQTQ